MHVEYERDLQLAQSNLLLKDAEIIEKSQEVMDLKKKIEELELQITTFKHSAFKVIQESHEVEGNANSQPVAVATLQQELDALGLGNIITALREKLKQRERHVHELSLELENRKLELERIQLDFKCESKKLHEVLLQTKNELEEKLVDEKKRYDLRVSKLESENEVISLQLDETRQQKSTLEKLLQASRDECISLSAELQSIRDQNTVLEKQIKSLRLELADAILERDAFKAERDKAQHALSVITVERNNLQSDLATAQHGLTSVTAERDKAQHALSVVTAEKVTLKSDLATVQYDLVFVTSERDTAQHALGVVTIERDAFKVERDDANDMVQKLQQQLLALQNTLLQKEQEKALLEKARTRDKVEFEQQKFIEMKKQREAEKLKKELGNGVDSAENSLKEGNSLVANFEISLCDAIEAVSKIQKRISDLVPSISNASARESIDIAISKVEGCSPILENLRSMKATLTVDVGKMRQGLETMIVKLARGNDVVEARRLGQEIQDSIINMRDVCNQQAPVKFQEIRDYCSQAKNYIESALTRQSAIAPTPLIFSSKPTNGSGSDAPKDQSNDPRIEILLQLRKNAVI